MRHRKTFTLGVAADFYAGKKLIIIAGFRPGGGVDNNARLVGRHIAKFIRGNPRIINKNMPGDHPAY